MIACHHHLALHCILFETNLDHLNVMLNVAPVHYTDDIMIIFFDEPEPGNYFMYLFETHVGQKVGDNLYRIQGHSLGKVSGGKSSVLQHVSISFLQ